MKNVEKLGIGKFKDLILRSDLLDADISENDKTPSWDGNIFVYNNAAQKKADIHGVVPVQVKARHRRIAEFSGHFSVEKADLNNYRRDGGVLFVLVLLETTDIFEIYYAKLLPFDINRLEHEASPNTVSIPVPMFPFPRDLNDIECLLVELVSDIQRQSSSTDKNILSLKDLERQGIKDIALMVHRSGIRISQNELFQRFFSQGFYLYAQPKGFEIEIPVDYYNGVAAVQGLIPQKVRVGEKTFYESFNCIHKRETVTFEIGKAISLICPRNHCDKAALTFNRKGMLQNSIHDTQFLLAILNEKSFYLGNTYCSFPRLQQEAFGDSDRIQLMEELEEFQRLQELLDALGVKTAFDCSQIMQEHLRTIRWLYKSVVENKAVKSQEDKESVIGQIFIAKDFPVLVFEERTSSGLYHISNPFTSTHIAVQTADKEEKQYESSIFFLFKKEHFLNIRNIDYNSIVKSVCAVGICSENLGMTNNLILEMLKAYDENRISNQELLNATKEIATWLVTQESPDKVIHRLNLLQTLRRERDFSKEEEGELIDISEKSEFEESIRTAAYLLLGNLPAARRHVSKLSEEEQKRFNSYPIARFWNI